MEKRFEPQKVERKLYSWWEQEGFFTPTVDPAKKPFCIIVPPPNANGSLHVGHALFVTIQDILGRYHRMKGDATLLLPGADHAGILTQVVFERELAKKGKTRFDLGRDTFYQACYTFSQEKKTHMYDQFKALGFSCDWTREKFTLEPALVRVASQTFIQLYGDNLAYRGKRMINWCPRCATALSDLEVEHKDETGSLWYITYPFEDGTGSVTVATTRPETMLGDTAVAVHPKDKRYKKVIGKRVVLPLVEKVIPVIADDIVDPKFGTGVVKVTPAHDPVDFEIGSRNNLAFEIVIGFDDHMTKEAFEFAGLHKLEARKTVIEKLGKLIEKEEPYTHRVGHCERCKTVIEPLISLQWFISMKPLAKPAITKVKDKETVIIPKRFEKTYYQWLENIHDWCVSRQPWWGPQLPIWYCGLKGLTSLQKTQNPDLVESSTNQEKGCGEVMASLEKPTIPCPKCDKKLWIQDPDTFDTWFLSGQWPYTTLGFEQGQERKKDFQYFYPTSVMETGYEILFFWVARMMMLGLYRTGEIPFKTVYLHGLVRDALGEKMSKSKGNVIDPIQVVEKHGADALRMALISGTAPGNDSKLYEEKIVGYRNFANKIWNMGRFILFNTESANLPSLEEACKSSNEKDVWLLSELKTTITEVNKKIEKYRLSEAAQMLYDFLWHKLADIYIEYSKIQVQQGNFVPLRLLLHAFTQGLTLLHPFMPFITEEVYLQLPHETASLMISSWPEERNGKTSKK